jgi:hypothetical protein
MYNSDIPTWVLKTFTSAAFAALAAVSPATAGHHLWIFEHESPPFWELSCEVNRKNPIKHPTSPPTTHSPLVT